MRTHALLMTMLWTAASTASAAVIRVPDDFPTILMAVDSAAAWDSVLVAPGTWTEMDTRLVQLGDGDPTAVTAAAFVHRSVVIIGEQGAVATIVDGAASGGERVMAFVLANHPSAEMHLQGLTITGCNGYAVLGSTCRRIEIRECSLSGNCLAYIWACAVYTDRCTFLTLLDSDVSFNTRCVTVGTHAGIQADETPVVEIRRCRFEGNEGRAVGVGGFLTNDVTVTDCEFVRNRCAAGGAAGAFNVPDLLVERNLFLANVATGGGASGGALYVTNQNGVIRFNTFVFDSCLAFDSAGGAMGLSAFGGVVSNNTFYGCFSPTLGAAAWIVSSDLAFVGNVVAGSQGGAALGAALSQVTSGCNVIWGNAEGNFWQWPVAPTDLLADPLFCDPGILDLTVRADSPCVAGNTPGCGGIGAWGEGCGIVSVESTSWAKVKSLYR